VVYPWLDLDVCDFADRFTGLRVHGAGTALCAFAEFSRPVSGSTELEPLRAVDARARAPRHFRATSVPQEAAKGGLGRSATGWA
jgi:hypothetical protein